MVMEKILWDIIEDKYDYEEMNLKMHVFHEDLTRVLKRLFTNLIDKLLDHMSSNNPFIKYKAEPKDDPQMKYFHCRYDHILRFACETIGSGKETYDEILEHPELIEKRYVKDTSCLNTLGMFMKNTFKNNIARKLPDKYPQEYDYEDNYFYQEQKGNISAEEFKI
jgi:hypothetical protein